MSSYSKKVVLAGATGNLGPALLKGLLDGGYQVTALTRSEKSSLPEHAAVSRAVVDYESRESLAAAVKGHSAVVSALPPASHGTAEDKPGAESLLLDAALEAGVPRFVPSGFGSDYGTPKGGSLPLFKSKVASVERLKALASEGKISWLSIASGPYLDFCIMVGLFLKPKDKSVEYYDGGAVPFSSTTLPTVGRALAASLDKWDEVKNRFVHVQEALVTQKQLVNAAKGFTGTEGWTETEASVKEIEADARAKYASGNVDTRAVFGILKAAVWGAEYGGAFAKTDNALLGIKELSEDEVAAIVQQYC